MGDQRGSKQSANSILDRLADEEAIVVLRHLLEKHGELRPEAESIAVHFISSQSAEDIAAEVSDALTGIDLDALNGRAGRHSWGYVEPSEAAVELLEEAIEERVEDMKRRLGMEMVASAQTLCGGLIEGLYASRKPNSDGALGWAPDFPAEHAGFLVQEFLELSRYKLTSAERIKFIDRLVSRAPEWKDMFHRAMHA